MPTLERQRDFGKAKVKADHGADLANGRIKWWQYLTSGLGCFAFSHDWAVWDLKIEEMQFLVALDKLAFLVDPDQRILDPLAVRVVARFMNSYRYGKRVLLRVFLQSKNEGRLICWLAQRYAFFRRAPNVIARFRKEERLDCLSWGK